MCMLDPSRLNADQRERIVEASEPLKSRRIEKALTELSLGDRIRFDRVVMPEYGLEHIYNDLVTALRGLLEARLVR